MEWSEIRLLFGLRQTIGLEKGIKLILSQRGNNGETGEPK